MNGIKSQISGNRALRISGSPELLACPPAELVDFSTAEPALDPSLDFFFFLVVFSVAIAGPSCDGVRPPASQRPWSAWRLSTLLPRTARPLRPRASDPAAVFRPPSPARSGLSRAHRAWGRSRRSAAPDRARARASGARPSLREQR